MKARTDIHVQIRRFRGIFRRKPGEKLATQELLEDRAEDLRLVTDAPKRYGDGAKSQVATIRKASRKAKRRRAMIHGTTMYRSQGTDR